MYKAVRPHKPMLQEDRAWHVVCCVLHNARCLRTCLFFTDLVNINIILISTDFQNTKKRNHEANILNKSYMKYQEKVKHIRDDVTCTCITVQVMR